MDSDQAGTMKATPEDPVESAWSRFEKVLAVRQEGDVTFKARAREAIRELTVLAHGTRREREAVDAIVARVQSLFPGEPRSGEPLEAPVLRLLERLYRGERTGSPQSFVQIDAAMERLFPAVSATNQPLADRVQAALELGASSHGQVHRLAAGILKEFPEESRVNESAVDMAMRLLKQARRVDGVVERAFPGGIAGQPAWMRVEFLLGEYGQLQRQFAALTTALNDALAKYFPNVGVMGAPVGDAVIRALQLGREAIDAPPNSGAAAAYRRLDGEQNRLINAMGDGYEVRRKAGESGIDTAVRLLVIDESNRNVIRKYLADEGLPVPTFDTPVDALLELAMNRKATIEEYERLGIHLEKRALRPASDDAPQVATPTRPPMANNELVGQLATDDDVLIQANNHLERAKQAVTEASAQRARTLAEVQRRLNASTTK